MTALMNEVISPIVSLGAGANEPASEFAGIKPKTTDFVHGMAQAVRVPARLLPLVSVEEALRRAMAV